MVIEINDRWQIKTDALQFILQRRSWNKEKKKWSEWANIAYSKNLAPILEVMIERRVFAHEGNYPAAALEMLAAFLDEIRLEVRAVQCKLSK